MPLSAWIMFVFGCVVLYGGLGICVFIALKNRGHSK
ncbi:MetS family NSS transporter small subunit [bacterium]|nr:MetS family NSS transporter small subunit [bacterium]